jgi:hypothetical protein
LHSEAVQNIAKYHSPSQRCFLLESRLGNGRDAEFPSGPLLIYLFNPLPDADLTRFIARLQDSVLARPRPVYLIYHNPVLEHVLSRSPLLRKIAGTHQYSIYASLEAQACRRVSTL